jgi:stearoyl-CoA desaturase (delta-9 desaturase)
MGELFQNNHHTYGARANFGVRWFEIDPSWPVIKLLHKLGVLQLRAVESDPKPVPVRPLQESTPGDILASPADAE